MVGRQRRNPSSRVRAATTNTGPDHNRPENPPPEAVRKQLAAGDECLGHGELRQAAQAFAGALREAFDRNLHFDSTTSRLAADPVGYVAPFRDSATAKAVRAPRGRQFSSSRPPDSTSGSNGARSGGQSRVVVATRGNDNFLAELVDMLRADSRVDLKFADLGGDSEWAKGARNTARVVENILSGTSPMARRVEARLRPLLDGTDLLFIEWCTSLATLAGLVDPRDTRVVVRLHSYEVFTHWPHLLDFSRIDDMVFVSEHLRDFAVDAIPGLTEAHAPRLHVLPLARDLQSYVLPKPDSARFTVGLVGWGSVAKDPCWALEVIRILRNEDERYRLLLVGAEFDAEVSSAAATYAQGMSSVLTELEAQGAVQRLPQTDDVPSVLSNVGVVLSSSVRESFHSALLEGAASGAVPVVRDWPFFAGRGSGPRTMFPPDWVVATPEEAAARILQNSADAVAWREAGSAAARHTLETWDWSVVRPAYERFFLGE